MRICHLCLLGPYNEGWTYQENILSKYHRLAGNEVFLVATPYMWEKDKVVIVPKEEYINEFGVKVFRCGLSKGPTLGGRIAHYPEVGILLEEIEPDVIFVHGVQCIDIRTVVKYAKEHRNCKVYVDNHADYSNSARTWLSKNILHGILWRHMAKLVNPYVTKFYGVLPARVDLLTQLYKLPKEKCELLLMGGDDEFVEEALRPENINSFRQKNDIKDADFLIVTGGKIDFAKTQTLLLMEAVAQIGGKVKLLIFGSVEESLKERFNELCKNDNIQYIGWISGNEAYQVFAAADLVVFPGRHSVFWEQSAALGKPMIVKYWEGTTHVDAGGNVVFLYDESSEEIENAIKSILEGNKYNEMVQKANASRKKFLYSEIARISI